MSSSRPEMKMGAEALMETEVEAEMEDQVREAYPREMYLCNYGKDQALKVNASNEGGGK